MQTKFTTDGKKVAIVGKLNNTETIVQEIFVSENGSEIPAGENFVVKSLLDAPAKSYKEHQVEKIENEYNVAKANFEKATEELQRKTREMAAYTQDKMRWMRSIADNITKDWFELVYGFVCGEYTHFVCTSYWDWRILTFDEFVKPKDGGGICAFGIWNDYDKKAHPILKLSHYGDGSGNNWTEVLYCRSYEEAIQKSKDLIGSADRLQKSMIDFCKQHSIEIPVDKMRAYLDAEESTRLKKISDLEKQIEKLKQS